MEIKDLIKEKRQELGLTYEQLGNLVGVGKSTVRKWETGMIENMRRDNIISLAKALHISPSVLMGWTINESNEDTIRNNKYSKEEEKHIENLRQLNDLGKQKVISYTKDLLDNYKYNNHLMPIAAHDDNLSDEEKENMNNIINDFLKDKL